MSPVDKQHSRHGSGQHKDALGQPTLWNCPGCGQKVEGVRVEMGCPHCGAGTPTEVQPAAPTPTPKAQAAPQVRPPARYAPSPSPTSAGDVRTERASSGSGGEPAAPPVVRIIRLIEYVVTKGEAQDVLRNSLVGTLPMGWGTLTGVIVDETTPRQEDLLNMARRQPGVWLANPGAMQGADPRNGVVKGMVTAREGVIRGVSGLAIPGVGLRRVPNWMQQAEVAARMPNGEVLVEGIYPLVEPPDDELSIEAATLYAKLGATRDAGGTMTDEDIHEYALGIFTLTGPRIAYTLGVALQSIAPSLADTDEPEHVLTLSDAEKLGAELVRLAETAFAAAPTPDAESPE